MEFWLTQNDTSAIGNHKPVNDDPSPTSVITQPPPTENANGGLASDENEEADDKDEVVITFLLIYHSQC